MGDHEQSRTPRQSQPTPRVPSHPSDVTPAASPQHGYDASFLPELDKKYACPVCLVALRNPVQTKCGHRFCKACLHQSCDSSLRYARCPVDNTWFDTQRDVFEDNAVRREVLCLTTQCHQHEDGCEWTGELRQLKEHDTACPMVPVPCPRECGDRPWRGELQAHLVTCPRRLEPCQHCKEDIIAADLTKHQLLECAQFPVTCSLCGDTNMFRATIGRHLDPCHGDCPLSTVHCSFENIGCFFQTRRKDMAAHHKDALGHHVTLLALRVIQQDDLLVRQQRHIADAASLCQQVEQQVQLQQRLIEDQSGMLQEQTRRLAGLSHTSHNGRYMWKISLPDDLQCSLTSPAFYTGNPGYKVSVLLQPSGHVTQHGEVFSSLYLRVKSGQYDHAMPFPFNATCDVTVLCQNSRAGERSGHNGHHVRFTCKKLEQARQETNSGRQSLKGQLMYMKRDVLLSSRFLKSNTLFIHIDVKLCI